MKLSTDALNSEIGKKYNRLTVKKFSHMSKSRDRMYLFICDCGTEKIINWSKVTKGRTVSCGCYAAEKHAANASTMAERYLKKHGHSTKGKSKTYISWRNMKQRVKDTYHERKYYYDQGVTVCDRWSKSFTNFLADMGERPEGKTLDRINPYLGYSPDNCRWADASTQARNQRRYFI